MERWTGKEAERAHQRLSRCSFDTSAVFFFSSVRNRPLQFGLRLTSSRVESRDARSRTRDLINFTTVSEEPHFLIASSQARCLGHGFPIRKWKYARSFGGRKMAQRRQICCMAKSFPHSEAARLFGQTEMGYWQRRLLRVTEYRQVPAYP